jgi:phosphatidylglycerol:prolipoprotein diacylglycerol transferase
MQPLFSIGPFTVYLFGMMIAIGSLIGIWLFIREAKRKGLDHEVLTNVVLYSLLGGIIGARIFYVLVYDPSYYLANPIKILFIHMGGLSIHGGIAGGLLVGYLFLKRHKVPIWQTLDVVAPSIILAIGISRIGCDVFGGPISRALPWGMEVHGQYLHPAQAYEFLLDFLLFGYLWLRLKKVSYTGQVFLHFLIGYMAIRGIVEFTRINPMVYGPFSVSHIMSLISIIIGIILIRFRKQKNETIHNDEPIHKSEYIKTAMYVIGMMVLSLIFYYWLQR